MKILFISTRLPYPTVKHAGGQFQYQLINSLINGGHCVDLISLVDDEEREHLSEINQLCQVSAIFRRKSFINNVLSLIYKLFLPPFVADDIYIPLIRLIKEYQKQKQYDFVQLEFIEMGFYQRYIHIPIVTMEHDVSVIPIYRDYKKQTNLKKRLKKLYTYLQMKRYEKRICINSKLVMVYSKKDAAALKNMDTSINTYVLNPPVLNLQNERKGIVMNKNILFVGNLSRHPNVEGVLWFYENVFQYFYIEYPDSVFQIVGADPTEEILKLSSKAGVQLYKNVDSLEPYYLNARVFVSPLFTGGGIMKKNIDAASMRCPIISTSIGVEGIDFVDNHSVLIADTNDVFLRQLVRIVTDDALYEKISDNARELIAKDFDWEMNFEKLMREYRKLNKVDQ